MVIKSAAGRVFFVCHCCAVVSVDESPRPFGDPYTYSAQDVY